MPHTAHTVCIRVVFGAACVCTYLFVICCDGSKFSLAKIIRIYECLSAVSDRPEAPPPTKTHTAVLIEFGHYCLVPLSMDGSVGHPSQRTHAHTPLKKHLVLLLFFFLHTVFEHRLLPMCGWHMSIFSLNVRISLDAITGRHTLMSTLMFLVSCDVCFFTNTYLCLSAFSIFSCCSYWMSECVWKELGVCLRVCVASSEIPAQMQICHYSRGEKQRGKIRQTDRRMEQTYIPNTVKW